MLTDRSCMSRTRMAHPCLKAKPELSLTRSWRSSEAACILAKALRRPRTWASRPWEAPSSGVATGGRTEDM